MLREVEIRDLMPMQGSAHQSPRTRLTQLTDDELLDTARNPGNGDYFIVNTKSGVLMDGNGRANELLRRAADPNSKIEPNMKIPVQDYTPDDSMFPDLD